MYQVYTFPACEKCGELKRKLDERGINYEEINAGSSTGRLKLRDLLKKHKDKLKRDDTGWLILPLVVRSNGEARKIFQGEDCLEGILAQYEN